MMYMIRVKLPGMKRAKLLAGGQLVDKRFYAEMFPQRELAVREAKGVEAMNEGATATVVKVG